jgi:hypothetical protein
MTIYEKKNSVSSNNQNYDYGKQANYDCCMRSGYSYNNQANNTRLEQFITRDPSVYLIAKSWSRPDLN